MALQLKKARSQVSMKLAGALFAIFALFVQPFVAFIPTAFASTSISDVSITIDETAPEVPNLIGPADNSIIHKSDAILNWSDVTDSSAPVTYRYQSSYNAATGADNALTSPIYFASTGTVSEIDARGSADGTYYWQARACDVLTNCSDWSDPWKVTIDSTTPNASDFSIDDVRLVYSKQIKVSASTTDTNFKGIVFFVTAPQGNDNSPICNGNGTRIISEAGALNDSNGRYEATLNTSELNGKYCANAQAEDDAGNHSNIIGQELVVIDNTDPVIGGVADDELSNTDLPGFTVTDQNFDKAEVDGTEVSCVDSESGGIWNCPGVGEGTHTIKATDKAGNTSEPVTFTIDTKAPKLTNLGATQNSDSTYTLSVTTDGTAESVVFTLDGTDLVGESSDGGITWVTFTSPLSAGSHHTLSARGIDAAGNNATATLSGGINVPPVDTSGPTPVAPEALSAFVATTTSTSPASLNGNANVTQSTAGDVLGSEDDDEGDVLGETTLAPSSDGWKILGIAWYWWLLILAAVGAAGWWFFGRTRSSEEV